MHSFRDRQGNTWTLDLTVGAAKRIKALAGIDLLDDRQGGFLEMCGSSDLRLIDMLYALVKPQADALSITDEQFGEAIGGREMGLAVVALRDEVIDFFLQARPPLGMAMQQLATKTTEQQGRQVEAARRMLADPRVDQFLQEAMNKAEQQFMQTLGSSSIDLPEPSASTPPT